MYKPYGNPLFADLEKSHVDRRINLAEFSALIIDGKKFCAWCGSAELAGRKYKWCSSECSNSAWAWANPQSAEGLAVLLARQLYLCADCKYDWNPLASSLLGKYGIPKALDYLTTCHRKFVKILKNRSPKGTLPEVDHIVPIYKKGISLGFDNHQILCFNCHKKKTAIDLAGKRKK